MATIDTNDFERAKGALASSLLVVNPIVKALQDAQQVFDVIQNAIAHRTALERDVVKLQQQVGQAQQQCAELESKSYALNTQLTASENDAKQRISAATADAERALAELHEACLLYTSDAADD